MSLIALPDFPLDLPQTRVFRSSESGWAAAWCAAQEAAGPERLRADESGPRSAWHGGPAHWTAAGVVLIDDREDDR